MKYAQTSLQNNVGDPRSTHALLGNSYDVGLGGCNGRQCNENAATGHMHVPYFKQSLMENHGAV